MGSLPYSVGVSGQFINVSIVSIGILFLIVLVIAIGSYVWRLARIRRIPESF